ncbi:MAG: tetratricopeptide repeat protein [Acidimicrobiales bacterium]
MGNRDHGEEERWYLDDQREFLLRSIDDARAEHDAGDLSDEDFSLLLARDQRRLSEVEDELEGLTPRVQEPEPAVALPDLAAGRSRRSPWRLMGMVASSALIVAGIVILLVHALNPRLPGQSSSGSITQPQAQLVEQQLAQATTLSNQGQFKSALELYDKVLAEDPSNPVARAGSGWLEWSAGSRLRSRPFMALGQEAEEKTVRSAPSYFGAHLYLGLILLYQGHNDAAAATQFGDFLKDNPPASIVEEEASTMRGAYIEAGLPVPAALNSPSG